MTERMRFTTAALLVGAMAAGFWYAVDSAGRSDRGGEEVEAATRALRAWASFAGTGELREVLVWFAVDGPQFAQLQAEAPTIVPGHNYYFDLAGARLIAPGVVRGSVTIGGDGTEQNYLWDIELVQRDGGWKVWSVRTQPET